MATIDPRACSAREKLLYGLLALACLSLGLLGLLLPVLPGLLFLVFGLAALARLVPGVGGWLRQFPQARLWLRQTTGFFRLGWLDKARYCFWLSLQLTVDTARLAWRLLARLAGGLRARWPG